MPRAMGWKGIARRLSCGLAPWWSFTPACRTRRTCGPPLPDLGTVAELPARCFENGRVTGGQKLADSQQKLTLAEPAPPAPKLADIVEAR